MDGIRQLQRQLHNFPLSRGQYISQSCRDIYTTPLYREKGLLDDQFRELQKLEDESNPEFVVEIVLLFFQVSEKLLNNLTSSLQEQIVDYKQVDVHVYQFKGSSSRYRFIHAFFFFFGLNLIGAPRVKNMCVALGNYCDEKNLEGCVRCLQQLKHEYNLVKSKLEALLRLEQKILAAGGSIPVMVQVELV
ncbi:hypothetical protein HYC85_013906 [Camellia sinensis]|uniref:Histidine-containing phosphotransfer protein n=1 Tax=Camellia sinensis TaxID=4442 RepID=A0A7J7H4Q9_CAMSI|nr:hypothetical protein HYC85_013906 [Camellia sinensis]